MEKSKEEIQAKLLELQAMTNEEAGHAYRLEQAEELLAQFCRLNWIRKIKGTNSYEMVKRDETT